MFSDPSGNIAISIVLIGMAIGTVIGVGVAIFSDYEDDNKINCSIGLEGYVGTILSGAISGTGQGIISTIILSILGSIVNSYVSSNFNPDWNCMVADCFASGVLSAVGYGIGQTIRYGASSMETKMLKYVARKRGNNYVNHILRWTKAGVNIGMKDINKISNGMFLAERDVVGLSIEALGASIPEIIKIIYE